MVKQCGCLPLAIVVLGGLLATKHSLSEWEKVHRNVASYLEGRKDYVGERKRMSKVLDLSYQDLPYELKPYFLYLAAFPEDFDIDAERLYHLWMAEGFVSREDGNPETMMEIAEQKLGELAQRCMVQVKLESEEKSLSNMGRRYNSLRLHDLMREFCLLKAKEENFLTVINYGLKDEQVQYPSYSSSMVPPTSSTGATNRKIRRLAIHLPDKDSLSNLLLLEQGGYLKYIRTLLFFCDDVFEEYQLAPFYKGSRLLKVLYFSTHILRLIHGEKIKMGNLILLRYFCLKSIWLSELPLSMEKLRYLQTLDLRTNHNVVVPNVLWKMEGLLHLYLPNYHQLSTIDGSMLQVDGLRKLETLENLAPDKVDVKGLFNLTNLRELNTISVWEKFDLLKEVNKYLLDSGHPQLQQACIEIMYCNFYSEAELSILRQLLSCHCLVELKIKGTITRLPEYNPELYQSLTSLILIRSYLKEDPMPTLEKLPNLLRLCLLFHAFVGEKMVCSSHGFPKLKHLHLWGLLNLEEWRVDNAMPNLSTLVIEDCRELKMLPDGLRFISTLRKLHVINMAFQFKNRLRIGGEDFHKVPETTSIVFN